MVESANHVQNPQSSFISRGMESQATSSSGYVPVDQGQKRIKTTSPDQREASLGPLSSPAIPLPTADCVDERLDLPRGLAQSFENNADEQRTSQNAASDPSLDSQGSTITDRAFEMRATSWEAMISNAQSDNWQPIGLLSTTDNHTFHEHDLGSR